MRSSYRATRPRGFRIVLGRVDVYRRLGAVNQNSFMGTIKQEVLTTLMWLKGLQPGKQLARQEGRDANCSRISGRDNKFSGSSVLLCEAVKKLCSDEGLISEGKDNPAYRTVFKCAEARPDRCSYPLRPGIVHHYFQRQVPQHGTYVVLTRTKNYNHRSTI
jgi:hypothetical protein